MKKFRKRKLNNKGLSLVEIIVTVVIVALVSAPIINSFMHAIQVNGNARTIQNGTSVAQDVSESFKVLDVEALVKKYESIEDVEVSYNDTTGIYKFEGIRMTGADGEDFLVDVTLDPTMYNGGAIDENAKYQVNNINLPVFSGLYNSDSIMLYRQYAGPDESLAELFEGKLGTSILSNINKSEYRKNLTKSALIDVDCIYNGTTDRYTYKVKVLIKYTYKLTGVEATAEKVLEKTYSSKDIHRIYTLCPVFDRYSVDGFNGSYWSSDEITIDYTFIGHPSKKQDIYFYLVEQEMNHINAADNSTVNAPQRIKPDNIKINCSSKTDNIDILDPTTEFSGTYREYLANYVDTNGCKIKVYTNIGKDSDDFENPYGVTYGDYNTGTYLYDMEVAVRLEGSDNVVATFNTAK